MAVRIDKEGLRNKNSCWVSEIRGKNPFRDGEWEDNLHFERRHGAVPVEVRGDRVRFAYIQLRQEGFGVFCYAKKGDRWGDEEWCRKKAWQVLGECKPKQLRTVVEHLFTQHQILGMQQAQGAIQRAVSNTIGSEVAHAS